MALVATLIASPAARALTADRAMRAMKAVGVDGFDWLGENVACDIALKDGMDKREARAAILAALDGAPVDVVVQDAGKRRRKLLLADMDSTMIGQECIDELADEIGVKDLVADITARAMAGEIEFEPALRERVALLEGLPVDIVETVLKTRITDTPGARALVATMRADGAYAALVSGGFTLFSGPVAERLGFDEHRANRLLHKDGRLTGKVAEPILGRDAKKATMLELCERLGLSPAEAMAVGDGANDLAMIETAGAGVAVHAKPAVAAKAGFRLDHADLTGLLYMQGYREGAFRS